jgi:hypothetical protein
VSPMVACDLDVLKLWRVSQCEVQVTEWCIATPCNEVETIALMEPREAEHRHDSIEFSFVQRPHVDPGIVARHRQVHRKWARGRRVSWQPDAVLRDDDPGWPKGPSLLALFVPGGFRYVQRRRQAEGANGLWLLRQVFVTFCAAIVLFGVVLVFFGRRSRVNRTHLGLRSD